MVYLCVIIEGLGVGVEGREDDAETRDARRGDAERCGERTNP